MSPTPRPHILIFNPDQWRGDVMGHLGNPAAVTPNLDAMAARDGVSFAQTYCQNPVCTPSRCSFMTGWYPHVRGHRSLLHMLQPDEPCLLKILKDNGYHVWWGGKNDLVRGQDSLDAYCDVKFRDTPEDHARWGYTRRSYPWIDPAARGRLGGDNFYSFMATETGLLDKRGEDIYMTGDWCYTLAAEELIAGWGQHAGGGDSGDDGGGADPQPLCLYMPLIYPHVPFGVEEPYYSQVDPGKLPPRIPAPERWHGKPAMLGEIHKRLNMDGWDETRWHALRQTYYGMCARVDDQFGRVVAALKRAGMYDHTAIFFFSDHGEYAGDYGLVEKNQNTFEDCLTRVPLLIKPPQGVDCEPGVRDTLTELIDVPATIYELAGIDPGYDHFGRSLLPVLADAKREQRDAVFCEGGRLIGEKHCRDYAHDADMSPQHPYWPRQYAQDQELPQIGKATMCRTGRWKYVRRLYEDDELYDLRHDPAEMHNLIRDPAYNTVLSDMRGRMMDWYATTLDVVPQDRDLRWNDKGGFNF